MSVQFWNNLLHSVEQIDQINDEEPLNVQAIKSRLETILIQYEKQFDPAISYEAFVTYNFCRAMLETLEKSE